jgi:hypothetical protein
MRTGTYIPPIMIHLRHPPFLIHTLTTPSIRTIRFPSLICLYRELPAGLVRLGSTIEDEVPVDARFEEDEIDEEEDERVFDEGIGKEVTLVL